MKKFWIILILIAVAVAIFFAYRFFDSTEPATQTPNTTQDINTNEGIEEPVTVVEGLDIPWELVFLPNGDMLVTEREGRLLRITGEEQKVIEISGVAHRGEGGLLGLAIDPNFGDNEFIYLYLTTQTEGSLTNRVERYKLTSTTLSDREVVVENIPGANYHDGGRIAFGPDGMLYITTGDAGNEDLAQNQDSLAGKILRVTSDGSPAVYSYGHRNVQGLAWDEEGKLWATEHGRSGIRSGYDELNSIEEGANYGWPEIQGDETQSEMRAPQLHSGASETWAPSGMAYLNEHLIFAGLRGESLYVVDLSGGKTLAVEKYLEGTHGRLRTITLGPDGMLYILTNNTDGRGSPTEGDDRIIRIDPRSLGMI